MYCATAYPCFTHMPMRPELGRCPAHQSRSTAVAVGAVVQCGDAIGGRASTGAPPATLIGAASGVRSPGSAGRTELERLGLVEDDARGISRQPILVDLDAGRHRLDDRLLEG